MALGHLTYLNIDPAKRARSMQIVQDQLKTQLANPETTPTKRTEIEARLVELGKWADGTLTVNTPPSVATNVVPKTYPAPTSNNQFANLLP